MNSIKRYCDRCGANFELHGICKECSTNQGFTSHVNYNAPVQNNITNITIDSVDYSEDSPEMPLLYSHTPQTHKGNVSLYSPILSFFLSAILSACGVFFLALVWAIVK